MVFLFGLYMVFIIRLLPLERNVIIRRRGGLISIEQLIAEVFAFDSLRNLMMNSFFYTMILQDGDFEVPLIQRKVLHETDKDVSVCRTIIIGKRTENCEEREGKSPAKIVLADLEDALKIVLANH